MSTQKQAASEALAGLGPFAGGLRIAEKLLLLTRDESLIEALASVVPPESLTVVPDEAALAGHLLSGHAGVVFIDVGAAADTHPGATAQLAQRLHIELPDLVLVVAGDGAAQSELAALVADGTIYRFVHKPVSAQRVKLFVDAAWRKRDGSSGASGIFAALSMPQPEPLTPMPRDSAWLSITVGVAVVIVTSAWYLLHHSSPTDSTPAPAPQVSAPPAVEEIIVRPAAAPPPPSAARAVKPAAPVIAAAAPALPDMPRPQLQLAAPVAAPAPIVAASPATAIGATVASDTDVLSRPSSTPPVSEARDPLSVAAVILQRVYAVDPEFPEVARENDLAGYVDLEFTVHSDGSVSDVTVLKARPVGVFEKSSIAAVSQWRYQPIERDGLPVTEHARLRLNFGYK